MDGERKIHMSEGVPLNAPGAANIFLNTGKTTKLNSPDGTVIHLNTEKPSDLGVHINTTFSIASSKKIKLLFVLNFLLSIICMVISCSIAFYYWNEMISMRRQLDMVKDHFIINNLGQAKPVQNALVRPRPPSVEAREPRTRSFEDDQIAQNSRKYYVEDLGEDMLLVDSKKKNATKDNGPILANLSKLQKELFVVQFNGGRREFNMKMQSIMGPWVLDEEVSSKDSETKIELKDNYFTVKEGGLYLIYAQVVYLTRSPNCYFVWARGKGKEPRLLSTCATGDDSSPRPIEKSQISCGVQTVARLYKDDIVNIAQREPNRTVWLRPGYSYIGFVKLSS